MQPYIASAGGVVELLKRGAARPWYRLRMAAGVVAASDVAMRPEEAKLKRISSARNGRPAAIGVINNIIQQCAAIESTSSKAGGGPCDKTILNSIYRKLSRKYAMSILISYSEIMRLSTEYKSKCRIKYHQPHRCRRRRALPIVA